MKKPSFSDFWQEFKAFAFKGNMIDLAVAVVIGAAFSLVINSLVQDIIMPSISYVTTAAASATKAAASAAHEAGEHVGLATKPAETQPTTQPSATQPALAAVPPAAAAPAPPAPPAAAPPAEAKPVDIDWKIGRIEIGHFVGALINFILVAFAVFVVIIKLLGGVMKKAGGTPKPSEPTTKECPYCLSMIPLRASKCANCTADLPAVDPPPGAKASST